MPPAEMDRVHVGHLLADADVGLQADPPPPAPLTLHQQVDDDGVKAPGVGGGAGVVAGVLRFH